MEFRTGANLNSTDRNTRSGFAGTDATDLLAAGTPAGPEEDCVLDGTRTDKPDTIGEGFATPAFTAGAEGF